MIKNKFLLYLLCGVTMSPALALGECKPTQDCRALGYKEAPCPEQGVKCPFGETWYCPLRCKDGQVWKDGKCTDVLGSCSGAAKNCKIGQILNSDASCSDNKVSGKTPIGVVIYISSEGCGWAMTAKSVSFDIQWSTGYTETGIDKIKDWQTAIQNFDACENTQKITAQGDEKIFPAAWSATNYAPDVASATKGKWCLPAPGMLNSLYINLGTVNVTLSKIGNEIVKGMDYEVIWSSSEYSNAIAWAFRTGYGTTPGGIDTQNKVYSGHTNSVRPVIEF